MNLRFDPQGLLELLTSRSGSTALYLGQVGLRLESQMKVNVTGGGPSGQGPHVRTGRLRASIGWEIGADSAGLYVDAGTNVPYGRYLEEGTDRMRPHPASARHGYRGRLVGYGQPSKGAP